MLPFTREQFLDLFATYNSANEAATVAAYPLALCAITIAWRGSPNAVRWVGAILALMWGWVGAVYHGLYFSQINPLAPMFSAAFVAQALLFVFASVRSEGLAFHRRSRGRSVIGAVFVVYAGIAYPAIGLLSGDGYPAMPLFGVAPCPLLIFTFGIFLLANRTSWWLWIVPILWSIVGGSAAILLSVQQDWALPISALLALSTELSDRRTSTSLAA